LCVGEGFTYECPAALQRAGGDIIAVLGEVDGSTGKDHRVFLLPRNLDPESAHSLVIQFKEWRLVQANLDDVYLATKPPDSN
jgi:hypothetical protein